MVLVYSGGFPLVQFSKNRNKYESIPAMFNDGLLHITSRFIEATRASRLMISGELKVSDGFRRCFCIFRRVNGRYKQFRC